MSERSEQAPEVARRLLAWYSEHKRSLPWRDNPNPYHVLVSEIMLQQTQVDRVLPKYLAWLERYPTLEALAAAPTAEVIRDWAGLGYNRRAINLQRLAQHVVEKCGGVLPATIPELMALPGIGRYTAGAVACFGFHGQVATVDTNIRRVLGRVFGGEPQPSLSEREMLALAEVVLPPGAAYDWNQALMDLGATICTAASPACNRCPLYEVCAARPAFDALRHPDGLAQGTLWGDSAAPLRMKRPPSSKPKAPQEQVPFTASRRYFRGRIVERLRALGYAETLDLTTLGGALKPDFVSGDEVQRAWLLDLVRGLERDGLVRIIVSQQVAEPRTAYEGTTPAHTIDNGWDVLRVALP